MKKIETKPLIITFLLIIFQSILFLLTKLVEGNPYLVGGIIDKAIPFNIWAIIPYCSWYILLLLVPYILYIKDRNNFIKYSIAYIIVVMIAVVIFVLIPTTVDRPIVTGNNPLELVTRFIFWVDTPVLNCFPSLHCAISCLWFLYISYSKYTNNLEKIFIPLISVIIMISTLVIKQHVFIDLVVGDSLAILAFILLNKDVKLTRWFKKYFKV